MVQSTTADIVVSVDSVFQPGFTRNDRDTFYFSYHIVIENRSNAMVQLISRFWLITDCFGVKKTVEGKGVVGEQPVFAPGDQFAYNSACELEGPIGTMEGYYLFENLEDKGTFLVDIPRFTLEFPAILC